MKHSDGLRSVRKNRDIIVAKYPNLNNADAINNDTIVDKFNRVNNNSLGKLMLCKRPTVVLLFC